MDSGAQRGQHAHAAVPVKFVADALRREQQRQSRGCQQMLKCEVGADAASACPLPWLHVGMPLEIAGCRSGGIARGRNGDAAQRALFDGVPDTFQSQMPAQEVPQRLAVQ